MPSIDAGKRVMSVSAVACPESQTAQLVLSRKAVARTLLLFQGCC